MYILKVDTIIMDLKIFDCIHSSSVYDVTGIFRLMPFRPLFPCVPWSRGTNNITLK